MSRVKWECKAEGCSRGVHYGTTTSIPFHQAFWGDMTAESEPAPGSIGVFFDDRPGVIEYHDPSELEDVL